MSNAHNCAGQNNGAPLASSGKRETAFRKVVSRYETEPSTTNRTKPTMPLYEYICRKCHEKFSEVLTIKEHETKKLQCPKCQSTDLEKVIEPFFAKTASKTRGY
jgi:putative FmdB family regulatory protein